MKRRLLWLVLALAGASAAQADSVFPLGKDWAQGHELPRPYGFGLDLFSAHQEYEVKSLQFVFPGAPTIPSNLVGVKNRFDEQDLKFDVWVLPFLNVFGIYGRIDATTDVDLSRVTVPGLPVSFGQFPVKYRGQAYGGGATLAYGNEHWFTSLTGTRVNTNLSGDFDSSVRSSTWQPRIGLIHDEYAFWLGGLYIKTEERHRGTIALPFVGPVPFDVELGERNHWNPTLGARHTFDRNVDISLELGGGGRNTMLVSGTWRFGGGD
jgi:opacity protein-like surface antigen